MLTAEALLDEICSDGVFGGEARSSELAITPDFIGLLHHMLNLGGLPRGATLDDVFAEQARCLSKGDRTVSIQSFLSPTVELVRAKPMTSGLYVIVRGGCSSEVEELLATELGCDDDLDHAQQAGVMHAWQPLRLAGTPVDPVARSAIRDDARVVVMNLDSMSYNHDYGATVAAGIVVAALPIVASRASVDRDHRWLIDMLAGAQGPADEALEVLSGLRRAHLLRAVSRGRIRLESMHPWTQPTTLANALLMLDEDGANQGAELDGIAAFLQQQAELERDGRERWIQSLLRLFAPVAGLGVLATILSAVLAVPSFVGDGTLLGPAGALGVVGALCVAAVLGGVILHMRTARLRTRATRGERRPQVADCGRPGRH